MSYPLAELPPMPDPDPEWKRRFEAKMADLELARLERTQSRSDEVPEPVEP